MSDITYRIPRESVERLLAEGEVEFKSVEDSRVLPKVIKLEIRE